MKNAVKRRIVSASFQPYLWLTLSGFCFGANRDSDLFDFPVYFKFFIGLFALVNPVGIIPSLSAWPVIRQRQRETKLTLQPTCLWPLSCGSRFFSATRFYNFWYINWFVPYRRGIPVVTIAMSMISGKLGEDKQNKQEKSETAVRESIGVVPLALPLMAGRGDQFYHRLGYALSQH